MQQLWLTKRRVAPLSSLFLAYFDFVCFCCESVFPACAVAERHQRGSAAPALGLNNFSFNDNQVRPILG
jgi:hypothetical protein